MTRKHFEAIAALLGAAQAEGDISSAAIRALGAKLAAEFTADNPRFDEDRFWARVEYWRVQHGRAS